jgi:hypothetical protein
MRRRPTDQDRAHQLLEEWAAELERAIGSGIISPGLETAVQNRRGSWTPEERYSQNFRRFAELQWAVDRVDDADPRWRSVLWQEYVCPYLRADGRPDYARMAEEHGVTERTWRNWRAAAKAQFLRAYDGRQHWVAHSVSAW